MCILQGKYIAHARNPYLLNDSGVYGKSLEVEVTLGTDMLGAHSAIAYVRISETLNQAGDYYT